MPKKSAPKLALEVLSHRELGREHYMRGDEALTALLSMLSVGDVVRLPDGRKVQIIDNFAGKNKAFKQAVMTRLDIKVYESELP